MRRAGFGCLCSPCLIGIAPLAAASARRAGIIRRACASGWSRPGDSRSAGAFPASRTPPARSRSRSSTCRRRPTSNSRARPLPRRRRSWPRSSAKASRLPAASAFWSAARRKPTAPRVRRWFLIAGAAPAHGDDLAMMIQRRGAGSRARDLQRGGGAQDAGERHLPPGADRGAARHAAVQARRPRRLPRHAAWCRTASSSPTVKATT